MIERIVHNENSDTTVIDTNTRVSVTTSRGNSFWLDLGVYPDNLAATLTIEDSKALRKALKRAERIAQEERT